MSAPGEVNWTKVAEYVNDGVQILAPLVAAADPAVGVGVMMAAKIIAGVQSGLPTAIALYNQIVSGTPPTPQQLQEYQNDYEASYQQLNKDISDALAKLPNA